ncbi:T9SS type B sorting domain-containing protein [Flavobacterium cerinum]|uniref:T9SS type B sorting domain-containing protein n=1 Tax=Flavobacterium cerinum TaxID=2502784 RepID=A0A3S4SSY0_9FLAO|nr:gliding motility-associated C-terminal domain-containing protein [Flavobacterium cerinum]RWW91695.1 T9SS type B sorting domain-containing protein [Flavobacterium cerinum]
MMRKKKKLFKHAIHLLVLFIMMSGSSVAAQVYQHNFGTTAINSYPYTVAPTTVHPDISGSVWTNNTGSWVSYVGSAGQALGLADTSAPTASATLTFTIAAGKQLTIDSFSFWRQRSNSGAQNWSMSINGTNVGNGTIPTTGTATGTTAVANPVTGLTGTVNVVIALSGASGVGTFRVDDFTLNGTVTGTCTAPVITSITPASGPANTIVTINGSGFTTGTGTSSIKFNGIEAASFTVVSNTAIKAVVPALATTGVITVLTNGCSGTSSVFTVLNSNCAPTPTLGDLYISELYDQQAGSGGMIEIYNPTSSTISLTGYTLQRYGNIIDTTPSPGYILNLSGSIGSEMTYLIACSSPNQTTCATPPFSATLGSGFNGNDKFELLKNNIVIDLVEVPFIDPGFTLIRKPDAVAPSTTYNVNEWNNTAHNTILPNNFCQDLGNHTTVPVPSNPSATITTQPISKSICENSQTTLTVIISNTTGFTYQWKVLNTSGNWVNVTNGANYSGATTNTLTINPALITFTDNQYYCEITSGTCTLISNAAQLVVTPAPAAPTVTTTQPTCTAPTGTITINTPTGLTYSIDGINFQASPIFTNLAPGNYPVTVKNTAGCISTVTMVTINPAPAAPAIADVTTVQPTCTIPTGSITINSPTGAGITYSIDGINFVNGVIFANLTPGTYTITVKNAAGCTSVTPIITINTVPAAPAVANVTTVQPTCTTPTGSITVNSPTGAGITYSIDGTNFVNGVTFANLTPGTYTITVKNAVGCTSVTPIITISTVPAAPAVANVTTLQPTCTTPTGSITVNSPTGAGLTYSIDGTNFVNGVTFANLTPGTYTITVKNAAGCTSVTPIITINTVPGAPAIADVTTVQPTCTTPTGTITVNSPTGAGLTYSIDGTNFVNGVTFANLAPGTYNITVKNAAGCTSITPLITINVVPGAPAIADVTTVQPTCTTPTGSITVNSPTGAGLTYSIDGTNFVNGVTFANLAPGTYTITVKNAAGCTSVTPLITINVVPGAPAVADVSTIQPTCAAPTGSITVNSPTGAGFTYSIDGTNFVNGVTFANLAPGTYNITVKNAAGCTSVTPLITIDVVPGAPAIANVTTVQPTCAIPTGSITVNTPTGAGLTYSIDGTNFQNGVTFTNLASGNYNITVKNAEGCTSVTPVIINTGAKVPLITKVQECRDTTSGKNYILEVLPLDSSFEISTATFKWKNEQGNTIGNDENTFDVTQYVASNNIDTADFPLLFTVTVTTNGGCEATAEFTVESYFCNIPKGISPNNDGMNDSFNLTGMNVKKLSIFNRYGLEVYTKNDYKNEWFGQSNKNDELPTGTYYYAIETKSGDSQTGWVYINRQDK